MKTLRDSFRDYVAVEDLNGENKYQAEGFGLQDAKKGIIFQSFPPVLHLQLKRFEYDIQRDAMVKVRLTISNLTKGESFTKDVWNVDQWQTWIPVWNWP